MKFNQNINQNIIAVAGTWDPVLPRHKMLFKQLLSYSKKKGLNPYVFIFYPNPANYLHENKYKDYFDLDARIALFKHLGINNIIVLDFDREDLKLGAAEFFDELFKNTGIKLSELWIGENQSFGAGPQGFFTIRAECAARNIKLRILKNSFLVNLDKETVYENFSKGDFALAAAIVGYLPTFMLKENPQINMHDGTYDAALRIHPFDKASEIPVTIKIFNQQLAEIKKPAGYNWLVLLARLKS